LFGGNVLAIGSLKLIQELARAWLFEAAAPMWSGPGVLFDGMFAERIGLDGNPCSEMNRRTRVQARQIYSFCTLGKLGWDGPWKSICNRALDLYLTKALSEGDRCVHLFDKNGVIINNSLDLYDHAFSLFALAHAGKILENKKAIAASEGLGQHMVKAWSRSEGGFWEGELTPCPPYRQNPHMHMFEAALANREVSDDPMWQTMMNGLRALFINNFRDSATGAVTEYFDQTWQKLPTDIGNIVEPGHCLEWAWLLEKAYNDKQAIEVADGLVNFAKKYGIDHERGVAINEVYLNGQIKDPEARLWPQTERLKSALLSHKRLNSPQTESEVILAYEGLALYFSTPVAGIWYDRMRIDGTFYNEEAPASSFYHIVCALNELITFEIV
jgi:mannose/cellobiose epimerase-like protein (N-acyl-D-glucosamine 2-epimerase family)